MDKKIYDKFIEDNKEEAVELLMTLGKIPAPSHHEDKRAEFCKKKKAATKYGLMKPRTSYVSLTVINMMI